MEDGGHLAADHAAADDGDLLREGLVYDELVDVHDALAVDLDAGEEARPGAGGDDDVLRFDLAAADVDGVFGDELGLAFDQVHLVLAEEEFKALDDPADDLAAAIDGGAVVGLELANGDAVGFGVLEGAHHLGVAQERLRGDAADVEADAAGPFALDDGGFEAVLGSAESGDVAARSGADHDDVVRALLGRLGRSGGRLSHWCSFELAA